MAHEPHKLDPPKPAPPPEPMPGSTLELLGRLPAAPLHRATAAATALVADFGGEQDRKLWGEFAKIARGVAMGGMDPGPVVNAYRQAMKDGVRSRGAKFSKAWKCLTGQ